MANIETHVKNCCSGDTTKLEINSRSCKVVWVPQFLFPTHSHLLLAIGESLGDCKHLWYAALNTNNFAFEQFMIANENPNINSCNFEYCIFYDFIANGIEISNSSISSENMFHVHKNYVMMIGDYDRDAHKSTVGIFEINYGTKPQLVNSFKLQEFNPRWYVHHSRKTKDKNFVIISFMGGYSEFKTSFFEIGIDFSTINLIKSASSCNDESKKENASNIYSNDNSNENGNDNDEFVCINYCPVIGEQYKEQSKQWRNYHSYQEYTWRGFSNILIDNRYLLVFGGQLEFDENYDVDRHETGCFICYDYKKSTWQKLKCRLPRGMLNLAVILMKYNDKLYLHVGGGQYRAVWLVSSASHFKYLIRMIDTWKQIRIVWIGYYKNTNKCLITKLSKDVVAYICSYIYQPENIESTMVTIENKL